MSENKAQDVYREASEITKYQILDKLLKSIGYSFLIGSLAAMLGALSGGYELEYGLMASGSTFVLMKPENLAQMFRNNLDNTLHKYAKK